MAGDKVKGKVAWFSQEKGFGFITGDADARDYFVHYTSIKTDIDGYRALSAGQRVEFTATSRNDGNLKLVALDVTVLVGNDGEAEASK